MQQKNRALPAPSALGPRPSALSLWPLLLALLLAAQSALADIPATPPPTTSMVRVFFSAFCIS
jgi:hypothetical protein